MPTSPPDSNGEAGADLNANAGTNGITLFLDVNLDGRILAEALTKAGATIERHSAHFAGEAPDVEWIPIVAARGWIILTRDRRIISRSLEVEVLRRAGAAMFAVIGGQLSAPVMAQILVENLPKITQISAARPKPFIAKIYRDGVISFVPKDPNDKTK